MSKKLEFGNDEHIKLAQLAKLINDCLVIEKEHHDCNCEYCGTYVERCPKCLRKGACQFSIIPNENPILKCYDCGQRGIYKDVFNSIKSQIAKLK